MRCLKQAVDTLDSGTLTHVQPGQELAWVHPWCLCWHCAPLAELGAQGSVLALLWLRKTGGSGNQGLVWHQPSSSLWSSIQAAPPPAPWVPHTGQGSGQL